MCQLSIPCFLQDIVCVHCCVHCVFTVCSLCVHCVFTACRLSTHTSTYRYMRMCVAIPMQEHMYRSWAYILACVVLCIYIYICLCSLDCVHSRICACILTCLRWHALTHIQMFRRMPKSEHTYKNSHVYAYERPTICESICIVRGAWTMWPGTVDGQNPAPFFCSGVWHDPPPAPYLILTLFVASPRSFNGPTPCTLLPILNQGAGWGCTSSSTTFGTSAVQDFVHQPKSLHSYTHSTCTYI